MSAYLQPRHYWRTDARSPYFCPACGHHFDPKSKLESPAPGLYRCPACPFRFHGLRDLVQG